MLLVAVLIIMFGVGGIVYYASQNGASGSSGASASKVYARFDKIEAALSAFVQSNRRLPCPADPTEARGIEPAASTACSSTSGGVVPWGSIGLSFEEAVDPWGNQISYRVFDGTQGFTRAEGLNATDCNTSLLLSATATPLDSATGLCATTPIRGTRLVDFYDSNANSASHNVGLTVNDLGTPYYGIAYVLISHGATGYGAYSANRSATRQLPPTSIEELANAGSAGTYYIKTESASAIDPLSSVHFDDYLRYRSASDLMTRAGLDARDWGWVSLSNDFATTSLVVNANPTPTSKLTFTFSNTASTPATISSFSDNLPSLAVAAVPPANYSTCTGTTYSPAVGTTTLSFPSGFAIPAATGTGTSKVNGTCTWSVDVYGIGTTANTALNPLINTIAAGTSSGGGMQTSAGWNLGAVSSSHSITTSFNAPTLSSVALTSGGTFYGASSAQAVTLTGTGFVNTGTVTFTNVSAGTTSMATPTLTFVPANLNYVTSSQASQIFNPTSTGTWRAAVTNPDGQASGTVNFTVYAATSQNTPNAASIGSALGYTVTAGSSTGAGTINFSDYTLASFVTNFPNIALLTNTVTNSGGVGIGVARTNGTTSELTSSNTGGLRMTLPASYRYFGVTLYRFGISTGLAVERAQVSYYATTGSATAFATQILSACATGTGTQAASYSLDPGASFAKVEIIPLTRTVSGAASSFQLGEAAFCTSASCVTLYSANNNASNCSYP